MSIATEAILTISSYQGGICRSGLSGGRKSHPCALISARLRQTRVNHDPSAVSPIDYLSVLGEPRMRWPWRSGECRPSLAIRGCVTLVLLD